MEGAIAKAFEKVMPFLLEGSPIMAATLSELFVIVLFIGALWIIYTFTIGYAFDKLKNNTMFYYSGLRSPSPVVAFCSTRSATTVYLRHGFAARNPFRGLVPPPRSSTSCPLGHWDDTKGRCIDAGHYCGQLAYWDRSKQECICLFGHYDSARGYCVDDNDHPL